MSTSPAVGILVVFTCFAPRHQTNQAQHSPASRDTVCSSLTSLVASGARGKDFASALNAVGRLPDDPAPRDHPAASCGLHLRASNCRFWFLSDAGAQLSTWPCLNGSQSDPDIAEIIAAREVAAETDAKNNLNRLLPRLPIAVSCQHRSPVTHRPRCCHRWSWLPTTDPHCQCMDMSPGAACHQRGPIHRSRIVV